MEPKHLHHKAGGQVYEVMGVGHRTFEGVAYWFVLGCVKWNDGTVSEGLEIPPDRLCCDGSNNEARAELDAVMKPLNEHLRKRGRWLKEAKMVGDRLVHWVAKNPVHVELFE